MRVIVYRVNAFTANSSGGNPAGVVLNADELNEAQMQEIAKQVGCSETAFICKSKNATKNLRFFTPIEEVELCGHATIASWSLMYRHHMVDEGTSTQDTLAGLLRVDVGSDGLIYMEQAKPQFYETVKSDDVAPLLGTMSTDFNRSFEPQVVSTGLKDLIVIVNSEEILNNLVPNFEAISLFSKDHGIAGLHVLCLLQEQTSLATARNFAPLVGINEESATGTSSGAALCYLKKYDSLPPQEQYRIEQGKSMGQKSYIYGRFVDDEVWIGGSATIQEEITINI